MSGLLLAGASFGEPGSDAAQWEREAEALLASIRQAMPSARAAQVTRVLAGLRMDRTEEARSIFVASRVWEALFREKELRGYQPALRHAESFLRDVPGWVRRGEGEFFPAADQPAAQALARAIGWAARASERRREDLPRISRLTASALGAAGGTHGSPEYQLLSVLAWQSPAAASRRSPLDGARNELISTALELSLLSRVPQAEPRRRDLLHGFVSGFASLASSGARADAERLNTLLSSFLSQRWSTDAHSAGEDYERFAADLNLLARLGAAHAWRAHREGPRYGLDYWTRLIAWAPDNPSWLDALSHELTSPLWRGLDASASRAYAEVHWTIELAQAQRRGRGEFFARLQEALLDGPSDRRALALQILLAPRRAHYSDANSPLFSERVPLTDWPPELMLAADRALSLTRLWLKEQEREMGTDGEAYRQYHRFSYLLGNHASGTQGALRKKIGELDPLDLLHSSSPIAADEGIRRLLAVPIRPGQLNEVKRLLQFGALSPATREKLTRAIVERWIFGGPLLIDELKGFLGDTWLGPGRPAEGAGQALPLHLRVAAASELTRRFPNSTEARTAIQRAFVAGLLPENWRLWQPQWLKEELLRQLSSTEEEKRREAVSGAFQLGLSDPTVRDRLLERWLAEPKVSIRETIAETFRRWLEAEPAYLADMLERGQHGTDEREVTAILSLLMRAAPGNGAVEDASRNWFGWTPSLTRQERLISCEAAVKKLKPASPPMVEAATLAP